MFWSRIPNFSNHWQKRYRPTCMCVLTWCRFELNWISLKVFRLKNPTIFTAQCGISQFKYRVRLFKHIQASLSYTFDGLGEWISIFGGPNTIRETKCASIFSHVCMCSTCVCVCVYIIMLSVYNRDFFLLRAIFYWTFSLKTYHRGYYTRFGGLQMRMWFWPLWLNIFSLGTRAHTHNHFGTQISENGGNIFDAQLPNRTPNTAHKN